MNIQGLMNNSASLTVINIHVTNTLNQDIEYLHCPRQFSHLTTLLVNDHSPITSHCSDCKSNSF